MKFSVWLGTQQPWADLLEAARHAELGGWDRLYIADHFMPNTDDDSADQTMLECWSLIAALAAAVPRVGLGTLVCGNTYRHPAVLANQAATADVISGGRVILGLGAGWQENEHDKYGIDFFDLGTRMDRFDEACAVVRSLLDNERSDFDGEHYRLANAPLEPKPLGPLPLLVGGGGERRTLRIAATHAQEWNVWADRDTFVHKSSVLDRHCDHVGRDPSTIHRSVQGLLFLSEDESWLNEIRGRDIGRFAMIGTPDQVVDMVAAFEAAGVDEVIVPDFTLGTGERRRDTLDLFATDVASHFTR